MYVFGTCVLDFPSSLHLRCRIYFEAIHRYQSPLFELPNKMKVQKADFQNQEDEALLAKEETQMYVFGTCVPDFPSSLHIRCRIYFEAIHRYQSPLFELPNKMKVQKVGFQNQEDEALLAKEETQMYVFGTCVPDFPSSLHLRCRIYFEAIHRYQSPLFELPLKIRRVKVGLILATP
ncbi:hypothetical protein [Paenibacillus endoradicis]|uniref:hypothetical protein n=1 Tax=Paenibacillus endoradicis TaxID=2972487 RepID=UPI0021598157|nr:hypothetical protein [Paenibacillus endoradicis]MCR8656292.1 hypothetical protein [Paenibacillus endoradicis]